MMKFLLVAVNAKYIHSNPGIYSLKAYAERKRGDLFSEGAGLPSVCVEIGEYTINNQMEQILEDIYRRKPDVIGFSCYIWNIVSCLELVRDIHKVLPDTDIWMGGPEVSFDAPLLMKKESEIFGVMKGEGEETFSGLLDCYESLGTSVRKSKDSEKEDFWNKLSQLSGVTYRDRNGEIQDHPVRPVMDMSRIPFLYSDLEGFENRIIYYESSRGCPFSCSYCLSSVDKSVRFRDLELVKKELQYFIDHQVPQVKFVDRTFNCKKSHALEIWKYIKEHDNGVTNFHFEIAADLLDEEQLDLIGTMRPGLIQLEIGVQSTNSDTIREIHRSMNLERLKKIVARINQGNNVHQHLDLIAGLPYENYDSFHHSFNDVYAMEPEQLQLGFLKVLKGSFMYENAEKYELVYREKPPYEVLSTKWLPYDHVLKLKGIEDMVEVYYNSRQFTYTLRLLEHRMGDAFVLYEKLAQYYEKKELTGLNHSRLSRFEILHDFITSEVDSKSLGMYEDALMCDLYLRENAKSRPSFALDQSPYKNTIKSLVPELRSLGTRIHVEVLRCGAVLLFDYRKRDPLTHNGELVLLGQEEMVW